jgi:hypothetical protein
MSLAAPQARSRAAVLAHRAAAELALLVAVGVFMALLGPFDSGRNPLGERLIYWLVLIVGGGLIGVAIDEALGRRLGRFWPRLAADSVLMTPAVTLLVIVVAHLMFGSPIWPRYRVGLSFQVFVVCVAVMALRQLAWRETPPAVAPAPGAETEADATLAFRQRLSARRREARLLAVQAEDHYLRVHTDGGDELITLRFADALAELAAAPGFRTHRSWWVAASALEAVRWRRGRGEARLACGLTVPVSRGQSAALKRAGWR